LCVGIDQPKINSLSYREATDALILNNEFRYNVITSLACDKINDNKALLVLAGNSLQLANTIFDNIGNTLGSFSKIRMVTGQTSAEEAQESFALLQNKKINCIVTTVVTDEGIDIPEINCLILAGGGKSFVKTIQRVGRGLRLKADRGNLQVIDILDMTNPYLIKHSDKRLDFYADEEIFESVEFIKGAKILAQGAAA
jgi:superfamily II DNA or RNA helicase